MRLYTLVGICLLAAIIGIRVLFFARANTCVIQGDADCNGLVNTADLSILATNWGSSSATWNQGDFNNDGLVNGTDLSLLASNYGTVGIGNVAAGISPGNIYESSFRNLSAASQQAVITAMKSAKVSWLRLDVTKSYASDTFISDATNAGISVDALLDDSTVTTPASMATFASAAATHLKPMGVHTYEIMNEVNLNSSFTAASYTAILQAAYPAIKQVDPTATVLISGLAPATDEPWTFLAAMYSAGAKGYFDAANVHPYSYPDQPMQAASWNVFYNLPQVYSVMQANGDGNKKVWLTEFGCPTGTDGGYPADCTDATLAQQITSAFAQANTWGWTGPLFIYNWQDDQGPDGDFGLYYANGSPKPNSLSAFSAATQ